MCHKDAQTSARIGIKLKGKYCGLPVNPLETHVRGCSIKHGTLNPMFFSLLSEKALVKIDLANTYIFQIKEDDSHLKV